MSLQTFQANREPSNGWRCHSTGAILSHQHIICQAETCSRTQFTREYPQCSTPSSADSDIIVFTCLQVPVGTGRSGGFGAHRVRGLCSDAHARDAMRTSADVQPKINLVCRNPRPGLPMAPRLRQEGRWAEPGRTADASMPPARRCVHSPQPNSAPPMCACVHIHTHVMPPALSTTM